MRLHAYAQLVRLPNVFTAMADVFLAGAATGAIVDLDRFGGFLCVLLSSSCLYMGGMVWNDWFDLKQDLKERPGRPIPSGRITPANAAQLGAILIGAGLSMAVAADLVDWSNETRWASSWVAVWLVAAIFLYDGVLKRTWMGPYAMGSCRFFNVLLGMTAARVPIPAWGYALALAVGVYIVGVTWFAKTEARASKRQTLLTAALVMAGGVFLGLVAATIAQEDNRWKMETSSLFPYLIVLFAFYVGLKLVPAVRDPQPSRVQPAVKRAILGLVLFDAILATSLVGWAGLAIAVLLAPAAWLGRWLYST